LIPRLTVHHCAPLQPDRGAVGSPGTALARHGPVSERSGIMEFIRDLSGTSVSVGTKQNVSLPAARQAGITNRGRNLPGYSGGLHIPYYFL
jgi:hypothetical protein